MSQIVAVPAPPGALIAPQIVLRAGGVELTVHRTPVCTFAACTMPGGPIDFEILLPSPASSAIVRPLRHEIAPQVSDCLVTGTLPGPGYYSIEIDACDPLYLFAELPETDIPDRNDPDVLWFEAGKIHEAGLIELKSRQTLYIEAGAIVKGTVRATEAENVRVCGRGILDGSHLGKCDIRFLRFDRCPGVRVEGIIAVGSPSWTILLGASDEALVSGVKLIGWHVCSDGVDVCGSRRVVIRDSFLRDNDDCIAIKAPAWPDMHPAWLRDVEDVVVERCVLYNSQAGNAVEIGFETRTEAMRRIVFRDLDIIGAHGHGAVFSIHLGDRAEVSDVLYADIRVEHFFDKLVDFQILKSRYSVDAERGRLRGVVLHHIRCIADEYNCTSLIGGYDEDHLVEDVHFIDFQVGDSVIKSADQLGLYTKHARNITFE